MRLFRRQNPFERIQKKFRPAVIFSISILFLVILSSTAVFLNIRHRVRAGLTESGTVLGYIYSKTFSEKDSLAQERDHYKLLSERLSVDQAKMAMIEKENIELQSLLSYAKTASYDSLAAAIIARSPLGQHTLLLDKGEKDGVREGVAIVSEYGTLIGIATKVEKNTTVATLLSHPNIVIPSAFLNQDGTQGIVHGIDGFLLKMEFVPQGTEISQNTVVVTSGFDGNLPYGLTVGIIHEVIKNVSAPFQEALIEPIADPRTMSHVLIIDPLRLKYAE